MIRSALIAAVLALTLAACNKPAPVVEAPTVVVVEAPAAASAPAADAAAPAAK